MTNYVSTLAYNPIKKTFPLIKKERGPERVIGKWTMIGGKINDHEPLKDAAKREFKEEAGIELDTIELFKTLKGPGFSMTIFYGITNDIPRQIEEEEIKEWTIEEIINSDDNELFSENFLCMFPFLCSSLMSYGFLIRDDIMQGIIYKLQNQAVLEQQEFVCYKKDYDEAKITNMVS